MESIFTAFVELQSVAASILTITPNTKFKNQNKILATVQKSGFVTVAQTTTFDIGFLDIDLVLAHLATNLEFQKQHDNSLYHGLQDHVGFLKATKNGNDLVLHYELSLTQANAELLLDHKAQAGIAQQFMPDVSANKYGTLLSFAKSVDTHHVMEVVSTHMARHTAVLSFKEKNNLCVFLCARKVKDRMEAIDLYKKHALANESYSDNDEIDEDMLAESTMKFKNKDVVFYKL